MASLIKLILLLFMICILEASKIANDTEVAVVEETGKIKHFRFFDMTESLVAHVASYDLKFAHLYLLNKSFGVIFKDYRAGLFIERLGGFDVGAMYKRAGPILMHPLKYSSFENILIMASRSLARDRPAQSFTCAQITRYHLLKQSEECLQVFMKKQPLATDFLCVFLEAGGDVAAVKTLLPSLHYDEKDKVAFHEAFGRLFILISRFHSQLFPIFFDLIKKLNLNFFDLLNFFELYLKSLIFLCERRPTVKEFEDTMDLLMEIGDGSFARNLVRRVVPDFLPRLRYQTEVDLFRVLCTRVPNVNLPPSLQMPLTVLFNPEGWPQPGTWPEHFNYRHDSDSVLEYAFILAARFKQFAILRDLTDRWLRSDFRNNHFAMTVAHGSLDLMMLNLNISDSKMALAYAILARFSGNFSNYGIIAKKYTSIPYDTAITNLVKLN